ncbi:cytochrome P450, partial [Pelatocladus sp. BLCC-F211]|uniref:cytochrome P450 n=1 Tax=Pelatocladus sp. BLCC-F211 TaxID=3342752 RepID=UPI0035B828E4
MVSQQSVSIQVDKINKIAPPGLPKFPFVGMSPFLSKHLHVALSQLAKKYGNIFQIHVGARTLVVLNGLETIKEALVKQQDSFNARADFNLYQQPPQCHFLEMKSGERWRKHRSIVSQVMHTFVVSKSGILENWALEEAVDLANIFVNSSSQPFDPNLYLPLGTLSFIQRLLFNKRGSLDTPEKDTDFIATARSIINLNKGAANLTKLAIIPTIWRPILMISCWKSLRNFVKTGATIERYLLKNLKQHQESFDPENLRDITDAFFKASSELTESDRNDLRLSENDIVNGSLIQFVGAGTELPNLMLRWALLYMITYPAIQAAIHKELDEVVGREQQPSLEHRGKLPFTEACINEIFRHSSTNTIPAFVYATTTDVTLEGYFIPQNTPLLINYYSLTRDERFWEEPEQFNPYRFLDENGKLRKNLLDKFYPFGIGSRRCIGEYIGRLLIFTFFTNLMHKCKFEKV